MAQFMIEIPHTKQTCGRVMDVMSRENPELFSRVCWGCLAEHHVGWGMVEADSKAEVRSLLPEDLKETARITEVNQYTAEDIRRLRQAT